jgi:hypothetical protein
LNYFIYARKSTDDEERQILSIQAQLDELRMLATKEGLQVVREYIDAQTENLDELRNWHKKVGSQLIFSSRVLGSGSGAPQAGRKAVGGSEGGRTIRSSGLSAATPQAWQALLVPRFAGPHASAFAKRRRRDKRPARIPKIPPKMDRFRSSPIPRPRSSRSCRRM